jgi:hypothetical protein
MKPSECTRLLAVVFGGFPHAKPTPETIEVYRGLLLDLEFDVAQKAVARVLALPREFPPSIGHIRSAVADLIHGPVRAGGEAWADVKQAIQRVGGRCYPEPAFADPVVSTTVNALGWRQLWNEQNETADRARFIELYDKLAARRRADVASGIPLPEPEDQAELPPAPQPRRLRATQPDHPALPAFAPTTQPQRPEFQRRMTAEELDAAIEEKAGTP